MRKSVLWTLVLLAGCDGATATPLDAGTDASASCECGASEACVRGVCIATCGADVAGFEAALGDGVVPIANVCRASLARTTRVAASRVDVYDLTTLEEGTTTHFVVSTWRLAEDGSEPSVTEVGRGSFDRGSSADTVFAGGYVVPSPDGTRALVGFTTSAEGYPGRMLLVSSEAAQAFDSPGNYDADFSSADLALIDALGAEGVGGLHGLYAVSTNGPANARHVVAELGDYSGSLVATPELVLASGSSDFGTTWPDGTTGGRVFVLPSARIEAALASGTPIAAFSDTSVQRFEDIPTSFTRVGEAIVSYDFDTLRLHAFTFASSMLTFEAPRTIATGAVFSEALDSGQGRLLLSHANGLLLVSL